ncbi:hypothetical protein BGZ93_003632 [Podila epicladia]|nr:hypothetical protein BGZ93_003632 [Podila epicladia]
MERQERSNDIAGTETTSPSTPIATTVSLQATQANLSSFTILSPSTVHQGAAAPPMTASPLATSISKSSLGTSLAAPTTQTLVFPGTGDRSDFLVMHPDPIELVLIHGNHPDENNEDDEFMFVLFEEDEPPPFIA